MDFSSVNYPLVRAAVKLPKPANSKSMQRKKKEEEGEKGEGRTQRQRGMRRRRCAPLSKSIKRETSEKLNGMESSEVRSERLEKNSTSENFVIYLISN